MFTGVIEEIGTIKSINSNGISSQLCISANTILEDTKIGDSIAVNGVCLTVTSIKSNLFTADVMAETLRRSNLGSLIPQSKVNLERAMPANGRFGGHIVSGHIDGTGTIVETKPEGNAVWIKINCSDNLLKYIIHKGSITLDGISLTVAKVTDSDFSVSIIPHTAANTTLLQKKSGDVVNLENDVVGKYIEKLLSFQKIDEQKPQSKITEEFLRQNGF